MNQLDKIIHFSDEDISRSNAFAQKAVPYNYNRGKAQQSESVRRILVGKLGEIAFAHFLNQNSKCITGNDEMFEVWESLYAADQTDFLTGDNRTIDIKTASKDYHRRITIPEDQFLHRPSDFYVGIRIAEDLKKATIIGYANHAKIQQIGIYREPNPAINYKYASYDIDLHQLSPIQELLDLIDDNNL